MCRDARVSLDVTQAGLALRVGVTRSYIGTIRAGRRQPDVHVIEAIADALGMDLEVVARVPIVHDRPRPRDAVHARCSGYVDRRLRTVGLETAREVEVVHGRSHGWIDLLAFDQRTRTLLVIDIKTRIDDLGAIERQLSWYERSAGEVGRSLGWRSRVVRSWLVVLASEEVELSLRVNRDLFDRAHPDASPDHAERACADDAKRSDRPRPRDGRSSESGAELAPQDTA